jgi:lipid-binding SYLF domain-containing protein
MMHTLKKSFVALVLGAVAIAGTSWAADEGALIDQAKATIATFQKADPTMTQQFKTAAGWAVFPAIAKGAFVVGGAGGDGILFERGKPLGKVNMSQATVGLQAGGQKYSQIIFFADQAALDRFKQGQASFSANVSAVAATAGASARAKYQEGVAVFVTGERGLMGEMSVGGQKFKYQPLERPPAS